MIIFSERVFSEGQIGTKVVDFRYDQAESPSLIFHLDNIDSPESLDVQEHWDKYVLIRLGVRIPSEKPYRFKTFFQKNQKSESCKGENLNDPSFLIGNNDISLISKMNVFHNCLKFKVEDQKKANIEFANENSNCKVEKINETSALISGGDCFIKAKQGQILSLEIAPNLNCNNREFLPENSLSPMEIEGVLETYIYPKAEIGPIFVPTKKLLEKKVLINLNAGGELLNRVTMEGRNGVLFFRPENLILPDTQVSNLYFRNEGTLGMVELGFLISTFGGKNLCNSKLCSNYQNFDIPFAPLLILYELDPNKNKKYEIGYSNGVGDRFPGQWNGEYKTKVYFPNFNFEKGKKYSIELIFSDPVQDFSRLKKYYQSLLQNRRLRLGNLTPGLDGINPISGFDGFSAEVSELPGLSPDGNFTRGLPKDPDLSMPRITELINDPTFPPNYKKVCNKNLDTCNKASAKEHLKIIINFQIEDVQGTRVTLGEQIEVDRISNIIPNLKYNLDQKNKPTIICK